jgi:hypothetical protein
MVIQCCKCHKVRAEGEWIRSHVARNEEVSHTYCPKCMEISLCEFQEEMKAMRGVGHVWGLAPGISA